MSSANTSVRAAAEACSANAHELVLTHLLAAWAVVPAPEIAAAIEAVSSHAGAERPALTARTQDEATKAWMRRARAKRPADLRALATTPLLLDRLEIDVRLARRPEFASAVAAGIVDITPDPWGNRAEFASSEGVPPEQDHDADQVA